MLFDNERYRQVMSFNGTMYLKQRLDRFRFHAVY
jgi:hypothetical protein